jgi:molybdopterin-containing oxidoreductase family membrane subunit
MESIARQKIIQDLLPRKFGTRGRLWVALWIILTGLGIAAYAHQLSKGLIITDMGDYASWGIYISNFVYFVAISLVGSLITAILRLTNVEWSTPLTRIAEVIAVSAIICASVIIVVDMGRPDRFYNLFIHGRLPSPIIWDVVVITTYFFISLLLLYFPLLPDLHILLGVKDSEGGNKLPKRLYRFLGSFWKNDPRQITIAEKSIRTLSVTIIPVAFAIHTVTSWLFATTYRPGWDSTNFGAYFISGAFLVGAGAVVVAMYVLRQSYNLERYITDRHFDQMGKIVVLLAFVYLYFNINEFLVPAYKMEESERDLLIGLFAGSYARLFWTAVFCAMFLPILILMFRKGRRPLPAFIAGILVVVGSWFKRYLIVTPTMLHPFLPMQDVPAYQLRYFPSLEEWAIAIGSMAGTMLIITILVRIFPVIPIEETIHETENNEKAKI